MYISTLALARIYHQEPACFLSTWENYHSYFSAQLQRCCFYAFLHSLGLYRMIYLKVFYNLLLKDNEGFQFTVNPFPAE